MVNQKTYLEHANITTSNMDKSLAFFKIVFPAFYITHQGVVEREKWVHFGNEYFYLALNEREDNSKIIVNYDTTGIKHLGFVVEDLEEKGFKLEAAGYKRSYPLVEHKFRRREYFYDHEGNDFELIEYFSDKNSERNDYEL